MMTSVNCFIKFQIVSIDFRWELIKRGSCHFFSFSFLLTKQVNKNLCKEENNPVLLVKWFIDITT